MFASSYQTGSSGVEVLSPGGTDPLKNFSSFGGLNRVYHKEVKGYVFVLSGGSSSLQCCGKSSRETMGKFEF